MDDAGMIAAAPATSMGAGRRRVAAAVGGGVALGAFGAGFSWYVERMPRLAVSSALTGVLAGALAGAVLAGGSPIADPGSRVQGAAGGAIVGASGGAMLLAGLAGVVLPAFTTVTRFAAMREFALHGALAGGVLGAGIGAWRSPLRGHEPA